jgi:hypothetical protein
MLSTYRCGARHREFTEASHTLDAHDAQGGKTMSGRSRTAHERRCAAAVPTTTLFAGRPAATPVTKEREPLASDTLNGANSEQARA